MTNRCASYFAALQAEAATYEILAIGECTTRLCRTHSYFDAACEADEMVRGVLPLPVACDYLVVLNPQGQQCGDRFPVKRPEVEKTQVPAQDPAPPITLGEFVLTFCWFLIGVAVGLWIRPML